MVCVACLLPFFLLPIVNLIPRLLDLIMRKIFSLLGKDYKQPVRVPPSCPYKNLSEKEASEEQRTENEIKSKIT